MRSGSGIVGREDSEEGNYWWAQGPRWRVFARVWLPFTLVFLVATAFIDDVHWGTRIGAACNVIAGLGFLVTARTGTRADAQGIRTTQFRTQHIAWADVEELRADPPGAWAADVQARLADGSTVTLPAVPPADLPRLEALRSEA